MTVKQGTEVMPPGDENVPIKAKRAIALMNQTRIARFKGSVIIEMDGKWHEMSSDLFAEACYSQFGFGVNKSVIADLEHLFRDCAGPFGPGAPYRFWWCGMEYEEARLGPRG